MFITESDKPAVRKLPLVGRKTVSVSQRDLIRTGTLADGQTLPFVFQPAVEGVDLCVWAQNNREYVEAELLKHGAILFRGFPVNHVSGFEQFIRAVSNQPMEYRERSSPRSQVGNKVYTSTDYPASQSIFPHNEHSYSRTFPMKLFFCCMKPAAEGGATPIGDCRKILNRISPESRERFVEKKWMYVRNFGDGFGLSWETVFQTKERDEVEEYCRQSDIECEWKPGNRLRTRQVRPAIAKHPQTGELVWFNHAAFFHVTTLEPTMRDALLKEFQIEDLPNNTFYGDGAPIEDDVLEEIRQAYRAEMVSFEWQQGDILMLNNMLVAHARAPFTGERSVLVGMSDPFTRQDY